MKTALTEKITILEKVVRLSLSEKDLQINQLQKLNDQLQSESKEHVLDLDRKNNVIKIIKKEIDDLKEVVASKNAAIEAHEKQI